MNHLVTSDFVELTSQDSRVQNPDINLTITNPQSNNPDTIGILLFNQHIREGGSNGRTWNKKMGLSGIQLPQIKDSATQLIYYYPAGLYVNYEINKSFFLLNSNYILIFTYQKIKAVGLDTMHGFLILKIKQNGK